MKSQRKPKPFKRCPRCGNKCLAQQDKCEECGLLFSRLEYASNRAAKKKLRHFDRDYVIYTKQLPKDVKWWKLLVLTICTGLVGGQYYYSGKYIKGGLMTASFIYLVFCTVFNVQVLATIGEAAYIPVGIAAFAWMVSLVYVLGKRFTVPVLVDIPKEVEEEMVAKRAEYDRVKIELEKERRKVEQEGNKQIKNKKSKLKNNSSNKTEPEKQENASAENLSNFKSEEKK